MSEAPYYCHYDCIGVREIHTVLPDHVTGYVSNPSMFKMHVGNYVINSEQSKQLLFSYNNNTE